MTARDAALDWCRRGFHPVPVPFGQKRPIIRDWPNLRITTETAPQYFNGVALNVGVLLGDQYGSADVDLDCSEAIAAAAVLLPETGLKFGRTSKPTSHYFYRIDPPAISRKFSDPLKEKANATLVELRCRKKDDSIGHQTVVPFSVHPSGETVRFEPGFDGPPANVDADVINKAVSRVAAAALLARHWPGAGSGRNDAFLALAGALSRAGWPADDAIDLNYSIYKILWGDAANHEACAAEVRATFSKQADGHETTGIPKLTTLIEKRVVNAALEWLEIANNPTVSVKDEGPSPFDNEAPYPEPITEEAFYGIAGEFVRLVEPHTEADRNFLLVSFLVHAGNLLGRDAWIWAGGDKHHGNLFACGVGSTSVGRKGSAASPVRLFFEGIDDQWVHNNIVSGLSSGEGLIWAVRDPIRKLEKNKKSGLEEEVVVDEGVCDKRLLVMQSEFFGALQAMKRQGNSLSPVMRDGWDRGELNTLVKNNPAKSTNAHISIVANITKEELLRGMLTDEMDNGFANRFLWVCSQSSKLLPEGGRIWEVDFAPLRRAFNQVHGSVIGAVTRDTEAADIWGYDDRPDAGVYGHLRRDRGGMFGKVSARAPAQVLRLALTYALLDGSKEIRREHLVAALAVWAYCEASAAFIFGDASGDPTADALVTALRSAGAGGMTKNDLMNFFGRHKPGPEIDRGLMVLHKSGRARFEKERTSGRSIARWFLVGNQL